VIRPSKRYSERFDRLISPQSPHDHAFVLRGKGSNVCLQIAQSPLFAYIIGTAILVNAFMIGLQANYMATHLTATVPFTFFVSELMFCILFTFEIGLRVLAFGSKFFFTPEWKWNLFDTVVVLSQLIENAITIAICSHSGKPHLEISENTDGVSVLRMLRIFRLLRILRLVRLVHIIGEFEAIVVAIANSMRSLCWTVVLMMLLIYILGVYLTQIVTDHLVGSQSEDEVALKSLFGSLDSSMLLLFQCVSDGVEWRSVAAPLEEISPILVILFCCYIAFVIFALMNMLTGIFVDKALQSGQANKRRFLLEQVRKIFTDSDHVRETGTITWTDFQAHLQDPHLQSVLQAIDVSEDDAHELFHLLDAHHEGAVEVKEFVNGCLSLDGAAKAIDLAAFVQESRHVTQKWIHQAHFVNKSLVQISHSLMKLERANGYR